MALSSLWAQVSAQDIREIWVPSEQLDSILKSNPKAVFLTPEQYQRLIEDAHKLAINAQQPDQKPPVAAIITSVAMHGQIVPGQKVVEISAKYNIESFTKDWNEIPLVLPSQFLGNVSVDGQAVIWRGKGVLVSRGIGTHTITAQYHLPITRNAGGESIEIHSPEIAVASLRLKLPDSALKIKSALPVAIKDNSALITIPAKVKGCWPVTWATNDVPPIPGAAVFQVASYLYRIDSTRLEADLGLILSSQLVDLPSQLQVPIPAGFRVLGVDSNELADWSLNEANAIALTLTNKKRRSLDLRIRLEQSFATPTDADADQSVTLPMVRVDGVHRASGTLTVLGSEEVKIKQIDTDSLTAAIPDDVEGPVVNLPGYIASYEFPVQNKPPVVTYAKLLDRFSTQLDTHVALKRESIFITRSFTFIPSQGRLFETTIQLTTGEELISVISPGRKDFEWTELHQTEGAIRIKWDQGVVNATPAKLTIKTRQDPDQWYQLGTQPEPLAFSSVTIAGTETLSGYLALAIEPSFTVKTTQAEGLEARDGRNTPVKGHRAWFRLDDYALTLEVSRKQPEVEATLTAYALPLVNSLDINGQVTLDIRYSGIQSIQLKVDQAIAKRIRFDSPRIAQQTYDETTNLWTLTFHEEQLGKLPFRYFASIPLDVVDSGSHTNKKTFTTQLPRISLPTAKRLTGHWLVEANTDTELKFDTSGLDQVDLLSAPAIAGYQPSHRTIAAFRYRDAPWSLKINGTRHPHSKTVSTVIDSLLLDTVVSTDGDERHQALIAVRTSSDQFLDLQMPKDSVLWSLLVNQKRAKPVRSGRDCLRVLLPTQSANQTKPTRIRVIYATPGRAWRSAGRERLEPLRVANEIPVMISQWQLHLPEGYDYQRFNSNLQKEFTISDRFLLGQAYQSFKMRRRKMPRTIVASDSAPVDSLPIDQTTSLSQAYIQRLQKQVKLADEIALKGAGFLADGKFEEAFDEYQTSLELLPDAPSTQPNRRAYVKQYSKAGVSLARQHADGGHYNQAFKLLEEILRPTVSPENPDAKKLLSQLNDPEYYSPALTPEQWQRVQWIKQALKTAQAYLHHGDPDRAEREYFRDLNADRYNSAARRSLDEVDRRRQNYYDVARDQTRATFLRQIAQEWRTPAPSSIDSQTDSYDASIRNQQDKLNYIRIPSLEFSDTPLSDAINFIRQKSIDLDFLEADPNKKGINIILPESESGVGSTPITLRLTNVPIGEALRYTANLAQLKLKIDSHAVVIVPLSTPDSELFTNTYKVPADFLSRSSGIDVPSTRPPVDPFAYVADSSATPGVRRSARNVLENMGISFGTGATAVYNPSSGTITIRNTPDQMDLMERAIDAFPTESGDGKHLEPIIRSQPIGGNLNNDLQTYKYQIGSEIRDRIGNDRAAAGSMESSNSNPFAEADSSADPFADSRPRTIRQIFESSGILFPADASIDYDHHSGELSVTNSSDQVELVELYLKSISGDRPIVNADPFARLESAPIVQPQNFPLVDELYSLEQLFETADAAINQNQDFLNNTQIENLDFTDQTVDQALKLLQDQLAHITSGGHSAGSNLQIDYQQTPQAEQPTKQAKLGFSIDKATVSEVLDRITGNSKTRYFVTRGGVLVADKQANRQPMESVYIPMPAKVFQTVSKNGTIHQHHARNVLTTAGIKFPRGAGVAYNPVSGHLSVRNTRKNLEKIMHTYAPEVKAAKLNPDAPENDLRYSSKYLGGAAQLKGFAVGDIGRLPIGFELPESGRIYSFNGFYAPDHLKFRYVNWERQIRIAWFWIAIGFLGFLLGAVWLARMPLFAGILVAILLALIPVLITGHLSAFCNALLIGWLTGMIGWVLWILTRRLSIRSVALLIFTTILSHSIQAEDSLPTHTVFVPYDSAQPVNDQQASRYLVDYPTFEKLWQQAKTYRQNLADSQKDSIDKADYIISHSLYRVESKPQTVDITARLTIITRGSAWQTIPIPFTGAKLTSLSLDGKPAPLQQGKLLINEAGSHLVEATLRIPVPETKSSVSWQIPESSGVLVEIQMDSELAEPILQKDWPLAKSIKQGRTRYTAALGKTKQINFRRRLATTNRQLDRPNLASIDAQLFVAKGLERLEADYHLQFDGEAIKRFSIDFDNRFTPVQMDIPNLATWEIDQQDNRQQLTFELTQPAKHSLKVSLVAERMVKHNEAQARSFPELGSDAIRIEQRRSLLRANGVTIRPTPGSRHRQIADRDAAQGGFDVVATYSLPGNNDPLSYRVFDQKTNNSVEANYVYQVGPDKMETIAQLQYRSPDQPLLKVAMTIPPESKIQLIQGPRVRDWWRSNDVLHIRLLGETPAVTQLLVYVTTKLDGQETSLPITPFKQLEFDPKSVTGTGMIVGHASQAMSLNFDQKRNIIREIGVDEIASDFVVLRPLERKRGFRFEQMNFSGTVTSAPIKARFESLWVMFAQVHESWVNLSVQADLEITRGGIEQVSLTTSLDTPEFRVIGQDIRETQITEVDDQRIYTIYFQQFITNDVRFNLEAELPSNGQTILPDIHINDASALQRFIIVENRSGEQMQLTSEQVNTTVIDQLPYKPSILNSAQIFRAQPNWQLAIDLEELETSAGNQAVILYADLTTALRSNGETWLKASYRLQNRSLQFLPIAGPKDADLISVSVAGTHVRADRGQQQGQDVYLVPLIQTEPGQLSYDVELVFRSRTKARGHRKSLRQSLDDPEVFGATTEKTLWSVHLPRDYTLARVSGNMLPVKKEVSHIEKLQSEMEELKNINAYTRLKKSGDSHANAEKLAKRLEDQLRQLNLDKLAGSYINQKEQLRRDLDNQKIAITSNRIEMPTFRRSQQPSSNPWRSNNTKIQTRDKRKNQQWQASAKATNQQLRVNDNIKIDNVYKQPRSPKTVKGKANQFRAQLNHFNRNNLSTDSMDKLFQLNQSQSIDQSIVNKSRNAQPQARKSGQDANTISNARTAIAPRTANRSTNDSFGFGFESGASQAANQSANDPFGPGFEASAAPPPIRPSRPQKPQLQPTGRRSIQVDFPVETKPFYYQKLKSHAQLKIVAKRSYSRTSKPWGLPCLLIFTLAMCAIRFVLTASK